MAEKTRSCTGVESLSLLVLQGMHAYLRNIIFLPLCTFLSCASLPCGLPCRRRICDRAGARLGMRRTSS